jgi:hypothetical protein
MKEKKLPIFIFSLLFACIAWASINLGNEFQTVIDVPVRVENVPPAKALSTPLPPRMTLKIRGTGWELLNSMLSPNVRYTIDFNKLSSSDTLFTYRNLNERISLPHGVHIFETSPETVIVRFDARMEKTVPIRPTLSVTYRTGFDLVGAVSVVPPQITIAGARSLLNAIDDWKTLPIVLKDVNAPTSVSVELADTLQLEVSHPQITAMVRLDVQPIAEKTIDDIPVEVIQAPDSRNILLIPPKLSIIIRSGVNAIASLTQKDFRASIDYTAILLDTSGMIQPDIVGPGNVKIVKIDPEKIQYVVRK